MNMNVRRNVIVGIIDYQAGNIQSIENAFMHIGASVVRVESEKQIPDCTHLVLPGVGAFGFCADNLRLSGFVPSLERWALEDKRPLLGICVGMQLLADSSQESKESPGLGWLGGTVEAIIASSGIRVPHVGWNTVQFEDDFGSFSSGEKTNFYFDHSFAYQNPSHGRMLGSCTHGERFSAIIERDNIVATQFHPEKSQEAGLRFLGGFLAR